MPKRQKTNRPASCSNSLHGAGRKTMLFHQIYYNLSFANFIDFFN